MDIISMKCDILRGEARYLESEGYLTAAERMADAADTICKMRTAYARGCDYCDFMVDKVCATCELDNKQRVIPFSPHDGHIRPNWCPVTSEVG